MTMKPKLMKLAVLLLTGLAVFGCSGELTDNASPVELVVTNTQEIDRVDLDPATTDADCDANIGTINMRAIAKNPAAPGGTFNQVRITRYRVSYRRLDGGTLVPAPFVRPMDTLLTVGGSSSGGDFTLIETAALSQAPFVALQPQNGGVDPETGRRSVTMQITVEVFGETLAGNNVYDATSFPLEFCFQCGGCA